MARLLLINGGKVQEVQMGQELTIGRAYSNLLRLEGEEISRVHAIIYRRGDDFIVRDLDSKNGVLLNGQKVLNAMLGSGDDVQLGKYYLVFEPGESFDVEEFMRSRNLISMTESQLEAIHDDEGEADDTDASRDEDTNAAPDSSMDPIESGELQIFYAVADVARMAHPQHAPMSMDFYSDLLRAHRLLGHQENLDESDAEGRMYEHFLNVVVGALAADRGVIVLKDEAGEVLRLGAIYPREQDVAVNRVVLRAVLRENQAVLCNDVQTNEQFAKTETIRKDNIGSLISYPVLRGEETVGLIYVDCIDRDRAFRRDQLLILHFISQLISLCSQRSEASQ